MTMAPSQTQPQLLILLAIAAHLILPAAAIAALAAQGVHEQQRIARPDCPSKCGDMSIPFPFGMEKPGCFLPGFEVTCNHTGGLPGAFVAYNNGSEGLLHEMVFQYTSNSKYSDWTKSSQPVELMDISLAKSNVRVYGGVNSRCFTNYTVAVFKGKYMVLGEGPFLLSSASNDLVGVGWHVEPMMSDNFESTTGNSYTLSCQSDLIISLDLAKSGSCSGMGCCRIPLPQQRLPVTDTGVSFKPDNISSSRRDTNPCSYGMVVERSWYNFSTEDMYGDEVLSRKLSRGVPLVLDFAIRNRASCPAEGQPPPPDYACVSGNSSCANATYGPGYVCNCLDLYDGNPYITGGCQDRDECELRKQSSEFRDLYPCSSDGICKNTLGGYECPCKPGMKGDGKKGNCAEIFPLQGKVTVGIAGLIVVFVLVVMANQFRKLRKFYQQNGGPVLNGVKNIRIYTKKQLKEITSNYKCVIGEGHFGKVYIGTHDNQQVAVKKSIKVDKDMKKEFTDEVIIQSEMRHKNIARLLGCCLELDVPMLVYEFISRGSLYDVLFKHRDIIPVSTRLRIALGSAEGLTYMHSAGESMIRHGDVKSANILLDEDFTPKVSDFGTSKLLAKGKAEKTERVIGDKSYIDPVYMETGLITQKSDVYSFGIVLIELITRKAATYDDNRSYVTNFVQACLHKRARGCIDDDVTSELDIKLLEMVSGVAVECVTPIPDDRLDMKQVEQRLFQIIGQSVQQGPESNYQGNLSPTPDDVALLKGLKNEAPTN